MHGDFATQVKALRGKELTTDMADKLSADATAIMAAIGCN